jgi:predicted DNA-binding protein YlxM (UPF0122 family)
MNLSGRRKEIPLLLPVLLLACVAVTTAPAGPAVAGVPVALAIITGPQTVASGFCSGVTRVQTQDGASSPARVSSATRVSLSGGNLTFYSDSSCSNEVSSVRIAAGGATKTFYFRGTLAGNPTLTASAAGLASASQTETISPATSSTLDSATSGNSSVTAPTGVSRRPIGEPLYGVTLDAVDHLVDILAALRSLSRIPTTRVVFDEFVAPSDYLDAVSQIYNVSYVMGEILDSAYVKQYAVKDYLQRTNDYLDALGPKVDIWEVGNEINGEWLGTTADVVAKMQGAYDQVKQRGARAALTLYYNPDCWSNQANEMFAWAQAHVPTYMKEGLDYVFISYYEDDCNGLQPDWTSVFQQLATMFPNSKLGFGENGTATTSLKAAYIQRYYSLHLPLRQYIGGHFWWYGKEDFVPWTSPLWTTLNETIRNN